MTEKKRRRWKKKDPNNERGRVAIRYRGYPTSEQTGKIMRIDGSCRFVKNLAKEQRDLAHRLGVRSPSYTRQSADMKELRDDPELTPWLADAPSQILQQAIRDTDTAYHRFVSGQSWYPTWTRKGSRASFRDPQGVKFRRLSRRWGEVKIQGVDWILVKAHRPLVGSRITSATVVIEPDGKLFISLLCERHKRQPTKPLAEEGTTVGIDRGIAVAIATSDGELINRENWTPKEKERLRRLEKARERKKAARKSENTRARAKGAPTKYKSGKQKDTELAIAALYGRARRRRNDFVEQESYGLAKNHRLSIFEDLHLPAMTRSAKGTVDNPGKRVAQKAGLNRGLLDKALGAILSRTEDKVVCHGHGTLCVPAPGTSITCPECGYTNKANRASRSVFICVACGHKAHADINAAIIIRERGIKLALAGGTPVAALQGNNLDPDSSGAEPEHQGRRGSGNQETGHITVRKLA